MEMKPQRDMVLLEMIPQGMTPGGIVVPDNVQMNLPRARVLACGPGTFQHGAWVPMTVKVGDVVLADGSGGYNVRKNVALLSVSLILAVVPDDELAAAVVQ